MTSLTGSLGKAYIDNSSCQGCRIEARETEEPFLAIEWETTYQSLDTLRGFIKNIEG